MAETELHAWRTSLHAYHLARITETPAPAPLPDEPEWSNEALQVVLVLDGLDSLVRHAPATIIPLEPPLHTDDALSFDWEDGGAPRRLRRSA